MIDIFFGSIFVYSMITITTHKLMKCSSDAYCNMRKSQQWRITFRLVRIVAGVQGAISFVYALVYQESLGVMNRDRFSNIMFASYCGYIVFELILLYITYQSVTAFFTDRALRILMLHHFVAGSAALCLVWNASLPMPHFIGLLNLGNEFVVVSYSLIVVYRKFGLSRHWMVSFNVKSLPVQYFARQVLFLYSVYYIYINQDEIIVCGFATYCCLAGGMWFMTFVLNPYWLYETIADALTSRKKD